MSEHEIELLQIGSRALKKAALNEQAKNYLLSNDKLFKIFKKAANRYIGGEILTEAVETIKRQNAAGQKCTVDFMGESVRDEAEANRVTNEFMEICETIHSNNLDSTISLDLSHIGLTVDLDLAKHNISKICQAASKSKKEVIISAEGVDRTDAVIEVYKHVSSKYDRVGITLQAYLYRTKDDLADVIKLPGKIRIVKGAFATPPGHSMERGPELDSVYLRYVQELLAKGHLCSIATHDERIQSEIKGFFAKQNSSIPNYEFESLLGIGMDLLDTLKEQGHPTRVYVVYGKEWYLYVCNRIAEYPLNLFRFVNDMVN